MNGSSWISLTLYWLGHVAAGAILVGVLVAPWLDGKIAAGGFWERAVAAFATDAVLRRTALASALGLLVTARVFFRSASAPRVSSAAEN